MRFPTLGMGHGREWAMWRPKAGLGLADNGRFAPPASYGDDALPRLACTSRPIKALVRKTASEVRCDHQATLEPSRAMFSKIPALGYPLALSHAQLPQQATPFLEKLSVVPAVPLPRLDRKQRSPALSGTPAARSPRRRRTERVCLRADGGSERLRRESRYSPPPIS